MLLLLSFYYVVVVIMCTGRRRYNRKNSGYGGQTKPILKRKVIQSMTMNIEGYERFVCMCVVRARVRRACACLMGEVVL